MDSDSILKDLHFRKEFAELCEELKNSKEEKIGPFDWLVPEHVDHQPGILKHETTIPRNRERRRHDSSDIEINEETRMEEDLASSDGDLFPSAEQVSTNSENHYQIDVIRNHLHEAANLDFALALQLLNEVKFDQIEDVCNRINLVDLPEASYVNFVDEFRKSDLSHKTTSVIIHHIFTLKMAHIEKPLSRISSTALIQLSKCRTVHIVEEMAWVVSNQHLGTLQCDFFLRLIKEVFTLQNKKSLLDHLLKIDFEWTDAMVALIQQGELDSTTLGALCDCLSRRSDDTKTNLKFSKLLQTLVTKHGNSFTEPSVISFEKIIAVNETFLKKSVENTLMQIRKKLSVDL